MQERTELSVHDQLRDVRAIGTLSFTNRVRPASDMSADAHNERSQSPEKVHAWIIGSDIAPLAAAVYLLEDAQLPAENIHLLNIHRSCGMEVQGSGDPEHGYVLRTGELPFFHDDCVDKLLSRVSSPEIPPNPSPKIVQESDGRLQKHCMKVARLLKTRCLGKHPKRVTLDNCHGNLKHRCELLRLALSSESSIEGKSIKDVFCPSFFDSNIWKVWSTTFRLQSHHRALEFRHQLYNYGDNLNGFNLVGTLDRGQYTINESIVVPITDFLRNKGVDMNNPEVIDLSMTSDNNPAAVSGIEAIQDDTMKSIAIHKSDIVIVSLGSMSLGTVIGSNISPPSPLRLDEIKIGDWSLWIKLSQRSVQYGEPLAFSTKVNETKLESFTMTFRNSTFLDPYQRLTHDHPGSGRLVSLVDSSWMLSISLPQCPIFPDQPKDVNIIWGYGLYPDRIGDFVRKPMLKCSGQEILLELLQHLRFSLDQIVPYASTIPMIRPLATASSVNQLPHHRPSVAPGITTNLAFVGPFTDFPWKAACSVEYSIRSAQYAAHTMMGVAEKPLPTRKSFLSTAWGFLR